MASTRRVRVEATYCADGCAAMAMPSSGARAAAEVEHLLARPQIRSRQQHVRNRRSGSSPRTSGS
jgi:hypothetical protein